MKAKWVTVQVTAELIIKGRRKEPWFCPVALAIKDALGSPVAVTKLYWRVRTEKEIHFLPKQVGAWIQSFDKRSAVRPFSFRIKV